MEARTAAGAESAGTRDREMRFQPGERLVSACWPRALGPAGRDTRRAARTSRPTRSLTYLTPRSLRSWSPIVRPVEAVVCRAKRGILVGLGTTRTGLALAQ